MKNLFEAAEVEEVKERLAQLRPVSERQWGEMNPAQALAHCFRGAGDGNGDRGGSLEANFDWPSAGAVCEKVDAREWDTHAPQFDNRGKACW